MTPSLRALPLLALAALAACQAPSPAPSPSPPVEDACGASAYAAWIGQDASVLASATLPAGTRVYHTGDALTMDFSPTRLNVELDAGDRVVRVWCG